MGNKKKDLRKKDAHKKGRKSKEGRSMKVQPPNDNPAIAVEAEQEMENKKKTAAKSATNSSPADAAYTSLIQIMLAVYKNGGISQEEQDKLFSEKAEDGKTFMEHKKRTDELSPKLAKGLLSDDEKIELIRSETVVLQMMQPWGETLLKKDK